MYNSELLAFEQVVEEYRGSDYLDCLRPGIDKAAVRAELELAGISSCEELEALYGWHDGTESRNWVLGRLYLVPLCLYMSLREAVTAYRKLMESDGWDKSWFPVFADGGGDFVAIDIQGRQANPFRFIWREEGETGVAFATLPAMLSTYEAAYRTAVFSVAPESGIVSANYEGYFALGAAMNPGAPGWD